MTKKATAKKRASKPRETAKNPAAVKNAPGNRQFPFWITPAEDEAMQRIVDAKKHDGDGRLIENKTAAARWAIRMVDQLIAEGKL